MLLVSPENLPANPGTEDINRRVRTMTKRAEVRVRETRAVSDAQGRTLAYEVDIE